jgi:hypothetical protein
MATQCDHGRVLEKKQCLPPAPGQNFVTDLLLQFKGELVGDLTQPHPFGHGTRFGMAAAGHRN